MVLKHLSDSSDMSYDYDRREGSQPITPQRILHNLDTIEGLIKNLRHHLGKTSEQIPYDDVESELNSIRSIADTMYRQVGGMSQGPLHHTYGPYAR